MMKNIAALLYLVVAMMTLESDAPKKLSGRVIDFDSPPNRPIGIDGVEVFAYDRNKTKLLAKAQTDGAGDYTLLGVGLGDDVLIEHYKEYYLNEPQPWAGVVKDSKITIRMSRKSEEEFSYREMGRRIADRIKAIPAEERDAALKDEWSTFRGFDYSPEQRVVVRKQLGDALDIADTRKLFLIDALMTARGLRDKDPKVATEVARREGFLSDVYFPYDKAEIPAKARPELQKAVPLLKASPDFVLVVEGYADQNGTNEYNMALAEERAENVRDYFASAGVDPARIKIVPYGEERPVCFEENETCQARNRSVRLALGEKSSGGEMN